MGFRDLTHYVTYALLGTGGSGAALNRQQRSAGMTVMAG